MLWPDDLELDITGIAQGGDGVGRWQDHPVFAAGALPGERVHIRLTNQHTGFANGHVVEVLQPAIERIISPCPYEHLCGAADWRWIDYDAQLRFKATILHDQLLHLGGIDLPITEVHGMRGRTPEDQRGPGWSYRTTAELHIAGTHLGYFRPNTHEIVDLPNCCLHHPLLNAALDALRPLLRSEYGLRGVTLRCAPVAGEVLAILDGDRPLQSLAHTWMAQFSPLVGVLQRQKKGLSVISGRDYLVQEVDGVRWHVSAGSFFQVNAWQIGQLIQRVCALIDPQPGERILDLFCGVGTFAIPLAQRKARVTGVESYKPAIEDARRSATLNNISNTTWQAGPVEALLAKLRPPWDAAVLDPPRRGCAPESLKHLLRLKPKRIVYVACHPGTLARDCKILCAGGYVVERAEVIDLFPQTHHVESIVVLRHTAY